MVGAGVSPSTPPETSPQIALSALCVPRACQSARTCVASAASGIVCPVKDVGLSDGVQPRRAMSIEAAAKGGYRLRAWPPVCEERGLICRGGRDGSWRCT